MNNIISDNFFDNMSLEETLSWCSVENDNEKIVFASSMGPEDQVIIDVIGKNDLKIPVFTIDTGRVFPQTYDLVDKTREKYGIEIEVLFPDSEELAPFLNKNGMNSFYESIENRKKCCQVRKISPLKKRLDGCEGWICGIRRDQSDFRQEQKKSSFDENFGLNKISPLLDWSEKDIWDYIKENEVPYNALHDENYPSIGCQPCTRAVAEKEAFRAGRWWWEEKDKKECGIHFVNGKVVRNKKQGD